MERDLRLLDSLFFPLAGLMMETTLCRQQAPPGPGMPSWSQACPPALGELPERQTD